MLMIRSDILLLSDEEVLASLYAYNKRKTFNDGKNLKINVYAADRDKNERANSILFSPGINYLS